LYENIPLYLQQFSLPDCTAKEDTLGLTITRLFLAATEGEWSFPVQSFTLRPSWDELKTGGTTTPQIILLFSLP